MIHGLWSFLMVSCNAHIIYLSVIMSHFTVHDAIYFSLFLRVILFTFQCFFVALDSHLRVLDFCFLGTRWSGKERWQKKEDGEDSSEKGTTLSTCGLCPHEAAIKIFNQARPPARFRPHSYSFLLWWAGEHS